MPSAIDTTTVVLIISVLLIIGGPLIAMWGAWADRRRERRIRESVPELSSKLFTMLAEHGKKLDELAAAVAKVLPPPPPEVPHAERDRLFSAMVSEAVDTAELIAQTALHDRGVKFSGREKQREAMTLLQERVRLRGFDPSPSTLRELALRIETEVARRKKATT